MVGVPSHTCGEGAVVDGKGGSFRGTCGSEVAGVPSSHGGVLHALPRSGGGCHDGNAGMVLCLQIQRSKSLL